MTLNPKILFRTSSFSIYLDYSTFSCKRYIGYLKKGLSLHNYIIIQTKTKNSPLRSQMEAWPTWNRVQKPGVNFINILSARFSYESASRSFFLVTFWRKKHFRTKNAAFMSISLCQIVTKPNGN
jgi:hypothetical protein